MVRSVLVAGGRSAAHRAAFERAVDVALSENARLTLVCIVPPMPGWLWMAPVTPAGVLDLNLQACAALRRELLDRVPPGLPVTSRMMEGPERRALLEEARRGAHDLVVVAASWRSKLRAAGAGDTARYLVRRSPAMVMVVRPPHAHRDRWAQHWSGTLAERAQPAPAPSRHAHA